MTLETLRSLQQRIREATGPDRVLDAEIAIVLGADEISVTWVIRTDAIGQRIVVNPASCTEVLLRDFGRYLDLPLYTLDPDGLGACKALMLEVLPGKPWTKTASGRFRIWGDDVSLVLQSNPLHCLSDADPLANDCLTFIDAIISAAIAEEEAKQLSADHEVTGS
jgi:hypothetical protein